MSSEKSGSVSNRGKGQGAEHRTSSFEPSEGVLASLSKLTMLKEPCLRLFDGGIDLGIAANTEVAVRDEVWNNDSIGCRGSLCGSLCSRD